MLKQSVYRSLNALGVPELLIRRNRQQFKIVYYHGFTDRDESSGLLNSQGLHLHVDAFRRQLEFLRLHFEVVSLDHALDAMEHGQGLPDNSVILTMDDGYRSNYQLAYPLLKEFSMPATIFIATNFVDRREYLWTDRVEYAIDHADQATLEEWAVETFNGRVDACSRGILMRKIKSQFKSVNQEAREALVSELEQSLAASLSESEGVPFEYEPLRWQDVREMAKSGLVSFGSHSSSHFILARCENDQLVADIQNARTVIEERTGMSCPLFCYPNGRAVDFDHRTREAVIAAGHRCALTTIQGFNRLDDDPYELKRVGTMNGDSYLDFVMAMCGVGTWMGRTGAALRGSRTRSGMVSEHT